MKKFVLYTALFGKPRFSRSHRISIPDVDRFCYTDLDIKSKFYQIRKMKLDHLISVRRQRLIKICIPDEIFDNYEYSAYVDYSHPIKVDFDYLLSCLGPQSDFATRLHIYKERNCIYDEGKACIEKGKGNKATILKQLDFYRSENYPEQNGLYATFIVFRRHTKKLKEFSKLWLEQLEKYSFRDQISLPYVAWKHDVKISICKRSR